MRPAAAVIAPMAAMVMRIPTAKSVEHSGRGAHHHRCPLERNSVGNRYGVLRRDDDRLCVSALAVESEHLARHAELFGAAYARRAPAAPRQVVERHPITDGHTGNTLTQFGDDPRHLMSGDQR